MSPPFNTSYEQLPAYRSKYLFYFETRSLAQAGIYLLKIARDDLELPPSVLGLRVCATALHQTPMTYKLITIQYCSLSTHETGLALRAGFPAVNVTNPCSAMMLLQDR